MMDTASMLTCGQQDQGGQWKKDGPAPAFPQNVLWDQFPSPGRVGSGSEFSGVTGGVVNQPQILTSDLRPPADLSLSPVKVWSVKRKIVKWKGFR